MPYRMSWYQEDCVAYLEVIGDFRADEMRTMNEQFHSEFLQKGTAPIHILFNATGIKQYPRNVEILRNMSAISLTYGETGHLILLGFNSSRIRILAGMCVRILNVHYTFVDSHAEANATLQQIEPRFDPTAVSEIASRLTLHSDKAM